ncbi:PepSY-like domain-containing protein [Chryseobacterium koreense]|uniref:PepSY-like domain-containing protein n=1 Tax=Chryseobacterium koreense TaxID=232216 RepID=UPI0026EE0457|nr:PepSY-like domain-containing protein [Chryseobacterium koreense]
MKTKNLFTVFAAVGLLTFNACKESKEKEQHEMTEQSSDQQSSDDALSVKQGVEAAKDASENINLDTLPASIQEFISHNYYGYKMVSAVKDPLCSGMEAIDVTVEKSDSPSFSLIFKMDGQFVQQETDINLNELPKAVLNQLNTGFKDYMPDQNAEKLNLADQSINYQVDLSKGQVKKEVVFKEDGTVVCTEE